MDSDPHDIFSTACACGCVVIFEDGNMIINHQPYNPGLADQWGVFEEEKQEDQ